MPRRTLMVYRDQGYVSDSASELIKLVRNFNWAQEPVSVAAAAKVAKPKSKARHPEIPAAPTKRTWH